MTSDRAKRNERGPTGKASGKTVSIKKVEANRQNALRSTGPTTFEGKKAVSRNALKYGLCSKEVVIRSGEGCEDPEEYERLLSQLVEDCKPVGFCEEVLVEEIANCYWRLRRVYRAETGKIAKQVDAAPDKASAARAARIEIARIGDPDRARELMRQSVAGIQELRNFLQLVIEEVSQDGDLSESTCRSLEEYFGPDSEIAYLCKLSFASDEPEEGDDSREPRTQEPQEPVGDIQPRKQESALQLLRTELGRLRRLKKQISEKEKQYLEFKKSTLNVLVGDSLDRILRYETSIKRHLYRAMDQLERSQRRRQGEHVPAPINVDVSTEK